MKLGIFHRGQNKQAEVPKTSRVADENERKLRTWNEILAIIRGTHPKCNGNPQYVMGVEEGYGLRYVSTKDVYHTLVTGITGSGKSVFLLSQIIQDILRGNAVFVFDPHGDLAEKLLTHIPRDRLDDVVYVNPLTAKEYGRVVRYNFLEVKEGEDPTLVKRSFMDALQKNYPDFWGPRLDAIMAHAIDLQFDSRSTDTPTLPKLGRVLSKKTYRENLLEQCKTEDVKDFWHLTFPKYRDDAVTAAQNKLYRILEETLIEPITSAKHSTVDFWNLMQEGKMVIFDIREGALTSEITSFIGTLFLARIYQAGMARERIPEEERRYVRVYVDEASRFMTDVLKENMQALRKYNVFLTVVSQNLDQFLESPGIRGTRRKGDLSQYTSTVVAFQSSHETARTLEGFFPKLPADRPERRHEHLERARLYHFYLSTLVGTKRENYYIKSIDPGLGENRPEEVIAHSLERYGEAYDVRAKHPVIELPHPDIGPAAYFALSELELRGGLDPITGEVKWISEESLQKKLTKFENSAVTDALFVLKERGLATSEWKKGQRTNQRFWHITDEGVEFLYPTTKISGDRLGGAKHIAMLCLTCKLYREMGFYPAIISGKRECDTVTIQKGEKKIDLYPDILLYPQYYISSTRTNPTAWDTSRTIAAEIEAYPRGGKYTGAHLDRTRAHFVKARDALKIPVIFVVQTEGDAEAVRKAIKDEGARVVSNVHRQYASGNAAIRVLGREYEKAIGKGMSAGTRLAMQVRKLAEMSRQANISDLGEPEDFFKGEKVPEYADRRWVEEKERMEKKAEQKAVEGIRKGEPTVKAEEGPKGEQQEHTRAGEGADTDESKLSSEEDLMSDSRRTIILACLKEGMTFWDEQGVLVAKKEAGGAEYRREIGPVDNIVKRLLKLFNISLNSSPQKTSPTGAPPTGEKNKGESKETVAELKKEMEEIKKTLIKFADQRAPASRPEEDIQPLEQSKQKQKKEKLPTQPAPQKAPRTPLVQHGRPETLSASSTRPKQPKQPKMLSKDRESQVVELKQKSARWYTRTKLGKRYVRAYVWAEGKRKEIGLGPFDEEIKQIFKKHDIFLS